MKNKNYSLTKTMFNTNRSFTAQFNSVVKRIDIDCSISPVEKPGKISSGKMIPVTAAWDTGSGGCLITKEFAHKLGLVSHRKVGHYYKGNLIEKNCYLAHMGLPNEITLPVELMEAKFTGSPIVIGFDIINKGNFSVKNISSKTIVSFEMTGTERVDLKDPSHVFEKEQPYLISEDPNENSILIEYGKIVQSLHFECKISIPNKEERILRALALWDTGSTMSAISKTLAAKLKVQPIGKLNICSVNAPQQVDTCIINIHLFDGSTIPVLAFIQDEDERQDLIIGMDVISLGEFSIESIGSETSVLFKLSN